MAKARFGDPTNFKDHTADTLLPKKGLPKLVLRLPAVPFIGADDGTLEGTLISLHRAINALPGGRYTVLATARPGGLQETIRQRTRRRSVLTTRALGALADERISQLRDLHAVGGGARETEYFLILEHREPKELRRRAADLSALFEATMMTGHDARLAEARAWRATDLLPPGDQWQAPHSTGAPLHKTLPGAPRVIPDGYDATPANHYTVRHAYGGERYCWSFALLAPPPGVEPGWLHELLHLEEPKKGPVPARVRLALTIEPYSPMAASFFLQMAQGAHTSTVNAFAKLGWNPSRRAMQAVDDLDRVAEQVSRAHTRLFRLSLVATVEALSLEALDEAKRRAINWLTLRVIQEQGPTWADLWLRHPDGFRATTLCGPHARDVRGLTDTLKVETDTVVYCWPCAGASVSMPDGPLLGVGLGEAAGQPFHYNPHAKEHGLPAGHALLLGTTGAGKSTLLATIAAEEAVLPRNERAHVAYVDPKGDFSVLCEELGGQLLAMSEEPTVTFNVCDLAPPITLRGRVSNPVKEQVGVILGLVQLACGGLTPLQKAITRECIRQMYHSVGIHADEPWTWTQDPTRMPTLATLYETLRAHSEKGQELAQLLESYAVGELAGLFARQTTARRDHFLTVYDLQDLAEDLQPLVVYLIAAHLWRLARRSVRRRIVAFDEVSALLADRATAHLLADMHRQGRSFKVACITSALELAPYLATVEGKACLRGALTKWLLRQENDDVLAEVAKRERLSPADVRWLTSLKTADAGSLVVVSPRGRQRVQIIAPPSVKRWLDEAMQRKEADTQFDLDEDDEAPVPSFAAARGVPPLELAAG